MATNTEITRLGQVSLTVTNLESSVPFYRDKVGLPLLFEVPNMAFFDSGGTRIMVTLPESGQEAQNSVFYFVVDEIEAAHDAMKSRGVTFVKEPHLLARMPDHELWMAFFQDPDGNAMALMCEKRQ